MAQQVEQLTRNEQVVRSNRISSSIYKAPSNALYSVFDGVFLFFVLFNIHLYKPQKNVINLNYASKMQVNFYR